MVVAAGKINADPQRGSKNATCCIVVLSGGWCRANDVGHIGTVIVIGCWARIILLVGLFGSDVMNVFIARGHNDDHKHNAIVLS